MITKKESDLFYILHRHAETLRQDLNYRLLLDEWNSINEAENILWVESMECTDIEMQPENIIKKGGN